MDLRDEKQRLRNAVKERLSRMSATDFAAESRSLCKQLLKALPAEPGTISVYYPIKEEADLRMAMEEVLKRGWKLYLPRFENQKLAFRRVEDLQNLPMGVLHIPEPTAAAELLNMKELTIAVLPGRAFDLKGGRLGRGNGGYDKWLVTLKAENPAALVWGAALDAQMTREVPMEAHDVPVDAVITARGVMERGLDQAPKKS
jgi:5-formyltetrahydrofolate cyclo-ligase